MVQIAIDGPSGAGKSSLARHLAQALGYLYVDTGALYRTIGLYMVQNGIDPACEDEVTRALPEVKIRLEHRNGFQRVFLNGRDVSDEIRTEQISMAASRVSAYPGVRRFLIGIQRQTAEQNNVLMDGRDIGTVILPDAQIKIFLTASPEERARRRTEQLRGKGIEADEKEVYEDILKRDYSDIHRAASPLRQAPDAVVVDTTGCTFEEAYEKMLSLIRGRLG